MSVASSVSPCPHIALREPGKSSFVKVDDLLPQVSLEQAAAFYGVTLPELHRLGAETRSRCFLACGRDSETGDRVLAIQEGDPAKKWHCHHYGCGKGGNLISLCDLMKPGESGGGRPRVERFKAIAADLKAMVEGVLRGEGQPASTSPRPAASEEPKVNVPLARSENERARGLTELDAKFVRTVDVMPPAASAYFRRRPFLTPEVCRSWRAGYLPRDSGGDHAGGTMRGKVVYAYHSAEGNLLTWFGRDPEYEAKHAKWELSDKREREPEKFHFVKGFHRGIELFGQERLREPEAAEPLQRTGLVVVEGPNDVIRMSTIGVPAVALCSNTISREQAGRVADLAYEFAGRIATVLLDCDVEGEKGMKQALGYLAQLLPVRLGWTSGMHGGKFKGRQPESLTAEEWAEIEAFLTRQLPGMTIDVTPLREADERRKTPIAEPDPFEFL
jgi:hypothetical protein